MVLSLRAALERWPHQLRGFALALALLAVVAPSWHICELGGAASVCALHPTSHHTRFPLSSAQPQSAGVAAPRALICYCLPREQAREVQHSAFHLSATPSAHPHATCLAQWLQSLPGLLATAPALPQVFGAQRLRFRAPIRLVAVRRLIPTRSRAPPFAL